MNKFFCTLAIVGLTSFLSTTHAQSIATPTENTIQSTDNSEKSTLTKDVNEFSIYYRGKFEKAAHLGLNYRRSYFDAGVTVGVSGGNLWKANLGGAYRFYLYKRNVYLDLALGLNYSYASYKYKVFDGYKYVTILQGTRFEQTIQQEKYVTKTSKASGVGLYLLPRFGFITNKGFGISIGYEMDAFKFKFNDFFRGDAVTLSLVFNI